VKARGNLAAAGKRERNFNALLQYRDLSHGSIFSKPVSLRFERFLFSEKATVV